MSLNGEILFQSLSSFGSGTLWLLFFLAITAFFFYSIFLLYHWFRYGMNVFASLLATVIYSIVSGAILLVMLSSFASLIT